MSSPKVEKAIALVSQIEAARSEVSRLEAEFEELISSKEKRNRKPVEENTETKTSKPRNRLRCLHILKRASEPMQLKEIKAKIGMSQSGTLFVLNQLIAAGQVIRSSYGRYAFKAS